MKNPDFKKIYSVNPHLLYPFLAVQPKPKSGTENRELTNREQGKTVPGVLDLVFSEKTWINREQKTDNR